MPQFWKVVNDVIKDADVLLLLLDARLIYETMNAEIENKVRKAGKPLIYVITKSDLADKNVIEKWKRQIKPCVFVSAKEYHGLKMLRNRILIEGKRNLVDKVTVGVLGYPNVGKSSLINSMRGRKSAPTSILSGYTKGLQKIKSDNKITFLDTPGVIPYQEKDEVKHSLIGTIDFTKTREPDMIVMELMGKFPGKIEAFYDVAQDEDPELTIEHISMKNNVLKKGGKLDIMRMSRMILKDWQKGVIK